MAITIVWRLTPISSVIEELGAYYGDVIEATHESDGTLRFRRLAAHSGLRMIDFLLSQDIVEADEFRVFADAVAAAGGYSEQVFGGGLFVYVPTDSPFDPIAELDKVVTRVKAAKDNSQWWIKSEGMLPCPSSPAAAAMSSISRRSLRT